MIQPPSCKERVIAFWPFCVETRVQEFYAPKVFSTAASPSHGVSLSEFLRDYVYEYYKF